MAAPNGLYCPKCKSPKATTTGRYRPRPGVRVRYFKCKKCGYAYRSVEQIGAPIHPRKTSGGDKAV
jgi:rubredoxin